MLCSVQPIDVYILTSRHCYVMFDLALVLVLVLPVSQGLGLELLRLESKTGNNYSIVNIFNEL